MSDQQRTVGQVVSKVLTQFMELRRKAAIERRQARDEEARFQAELEMVMDDVRQAGLHDGTPEFFAAVYKVP